MTDHNWKKHRALNVEYKVSTWRGFLWALYGLDIWLNGIPMFKTIIAANIVMWFLLWRMG